MVIFSVFVIVYCSTRIHFKVKNIIQVSNNQNVMEINRQVTKVLIIQALLPIISLIVPLIILILFWLLGIAVPMVGIYTYFSGMYFTSIKVSAKRCFLYKRSVSANCDNLDNSHLSTTSSNLVITSLQIFRVCVKYHLFYNTFEERRYWEN
jgi:low temperature requirement protein LtrA